jgi:uncharacterized DUF497 family protein
MIIEFDTAKREKTLLERGLDFADSDKVFESLHFIARDDRLDYGEERFITIGRWPDSCDCLDSEKRRPPNYFYEVRQ